MTHAAAIAAQLTTTIAVQGPNCPHPRALFTRVNLVGTVTGQHLRACNAIRRQPPLVVQAAELQQAEFSCPADRRAAVCNAELAVDGTLVGFHSIE